MAKTSGHGNGTRDETILALDLLLRCNMSVPGDGDARVIGLSDYLRSLPIHPAEKKRPSFRNPDGVSFKLQNLRAVATGKGLQNVSVMDKAVWAELGTQPKLVTQLAAQIKAQSSALSKMPNVEEADEVFWEGRTATALHKKRERSRSVRNSLLSARKKKGALKCDACGCMSSAPSGVEDAIFEAHHLTPLADTGPTHTRVSDMALVCANCHRVWHRAMANRKQWIGLHAFRAFLDDGDLQRSA